MLIDEKQLIAVIESYLPDADASTYARLADEIKQDIDSTIHSMIRQAVAHEHQENYQRKSRE